MATIEVQIRLDVEDKLDLILDQAVGLGHARRGKSVQCTKCSDSILQLWGLVAVH